MLTENFANKIINIAEKLDLKIFDDAINILFASKTNYLIIVI